MSQAVLWAMAGSVHKHFCCHSPREDSVAWPSLTAREDGAERGPPTWEEEEAGLGAPVPFSSTTFFSRPLCLFSTVEESPISIFGFACFHRMYGSSVSYGWPYWQRGENSYRRESKTMEAFLNAGRGGVVTAGTPNKCPRESRRKKEHVITVIIL